MNNIQQEKIKVFISYCHESEEHSKRVLALSDKLCTNGIDCNIDQYEQAPIEGWPRWMEKHIQEADYILIACTESYDMPTKKGTRFEFLMTYQEIYEKNSLNDKFIPIVFTKNDINFIPKLLKPFQYYSLDSEKGYEELYRRLTKQPQIIKPKQGELKQFPTGMNSEQGSEIIKNTNNIEIELKIDREFNSYNINDQEKLIRAIRELLGIKGDLKIKQIMKGSIKLTLELSSDYSEKLIQAVKNGAFKEHGVMDAKIKRTKFESVSKKDLESSEEMNLDDFELQVEVDLDRAVLSTSLEAIETVEPNFWVKGKINKLALRKYIEAKEIEWDQRLDLFRKALLVKKDVELKSIAIKADEAVEKLEIEHTKLMREMVVSGRDDVFKLMIDFGKVATKRFKETMHADIDPNLKQTIIEDIEEVWRRTHKKIKDGIEQYVIELEKKDKKRKQKED